MSAFIFPRSQFDALHLHGFIIIIIYLLISNNSKYFQISSTILILLERQICYGLNYLKSFSRYYDYFFPNVLF